MDEMVQIARGRLGKRASSNKSEAEILLGEFRRCHAAASPPAFQTVLDHVREIYDRAAAEEAAEKP